MSVERPLWDSHLFLGRELQREVWQASAVPDILRMLDRYGVRYAMASATACRTINPIQGNEVLFEAVSSEPRLVPCPCVIPKDGLDHGDEVDFVDELIRRGAKSVCHFPEAHRTGLDPRVIGPLYDALQRRRLPVSLFETSLLDAADLANRHPDLPIILHVPSYRDRKFLPAFRSAPKLHVSLMPNLAAFRGIEAFVREIGADRMLFASGFPFHEPGAPLAYLNYADISDADRRKIAFGNMERLVDAVRLPENTESMHDAEARNGGRASGICEAGFDGRPVELPGIVDMHAHYGRLRWFPYEKVDGNALIGELDRTGIEKIFVSPTPASTPEVRWSNDQVLQGVRAHPGRLLGYAICYPINEELGIGEIKRAIEAGLHGIKMHSGAKIPYTDPGFEPVWHFADERSLPVLLHTWGDLEKLAPILEKITRAPVLLGHSGAGNKAKEYVEFARRFANVYLELCWSKVPYGVVEYFVGELGADRVLWGSDAPAMAVTQQFGRILFADIPDEEKRQILVTNPKRILDQVNHSKANEVLGR